MGVMELFTEAMTPYYVYAPSYSEKSAGCRALYILCHALNRSGYKAFMVVFGGEPAAVPGWMHAPFLDDATYSATMDFIAVYPEIVHGNPLSAKKIARYLLFYPGAYGGPTEFESTDALWSYTSEIAQKSGSEGVLCTPTVNPWQFCPILTGARRSGSFYYAHKYLMHGGKIFGVPEGSVAITQEYPENRKELEQLLQRAEALYVFEDTTLALEALLCGCPVVKMRSERYKTSIGEKEFGLDGLCWSDEKEGLNRAKMTADKARGNYFKTLDNFQKQLNRFIESTQNL